MPTAEEKAEKLEALRAARAALAAAPDPEAELDAAIAAEESALALAEAQAKARSELGPEGVKWRTVETLAGSFIVMRPQGAAYRAFQDQEATKVQDVEKLVFPLVRFPSKEAAGRIIDEQPGVLTDLLLAVSELAGQRALVQAKK